ncbi:MAG: hypothetical protein AB7V16_06920 [Vulcanibacillus sp.]
MLITKLLISKSFLIRNKTHFIKKGYKVTELSKDVKQEDYNKDLIEINVSDLSSSSHIHVQYYCDYCSSNEVLHVSYKVYLKRRKIIQKDACAKCAVLKAKESILEKCTEEELIIKSKQKSDKLKKRWENYNNEEVENIIEKRKETCLKKYGVDSPLKNEDSRIKGKQTCLDRYGVENASQNEDIKNQKKKTYFDKTGYYHPQQNPEAKKEKSKRCLENYGVEFHQQRKDLQYKTYEKFYNYFLNNGKTLLLSFDDFYAKKHMKEYELKIFCNKCKTEYYQSPFNLKINVNNSFKDYCPICNPSLIGGSLQEATLFNWIATLEKDIQPHNRRVLDRKEIDIFLPSKNIGFEYNGLHWHSDNFKGFTKYTHKSKQDKAKEKGVDLFFIYDFEWLEKTDIVKSIIKNKLGIIDNKIFARKCDLQLVNYKVAKSFYENNHIQSGSIINSKMISIGLFYTDELVSLITLDKSRFDKQYEWELIRFCNKINTQVLGGFSKMLKYFERNYNPKSILTYSEARLFQKNTYESSGFTYIKTTDPNYFYIKKGKYIGTRHKFQKHKLPKILENFDIKLTEWENMVNNGYDRVWDCGNRVFVKTYG